MKGIISLVSMVTITIWGLSAVGDPIVAIWGVVSVLFSSVALSE